MIRQLVVSLGIFSFLSFASPAVAEEDVKHKCPVCQSDKDVIPIVYGKPGPELQQKAERGECRLGGCVIDKDSPRYYCKKDKKEF